MEHPHPNNFCGNGFPDWLEVNLTKKCNANCTWCVEKRGWHPVDVADWEVIADAAIETGRKNIILLGGEPTLHPDFAKIAHRLASAGRRCWVTTNGSKLSPEWVKENMGGVYGVNISVHSYFMSENGRITGLFLGADNLRESITKLHAMGATVRMNCNCIKGHIDSVNQIRAYIAWAKKIGADKIRFVELKHDNDNFVDLAEIMDHKYGTNDNPFADGCNSDARQMCGMQTRLRPCPSHPDIRPHPVLYYDGKLYDGWQQTKEADMTTKELIELLEEVRDGEVSVAEAAVKIDRAERDEEDDYIRPTFGTDPRNVAKQRAEPSGGGSCQY
ncbi:MAG: radical SAM protein [Candidatus Heimdallarchaeota archaeon]